MYVSGSPFLYTFQVLGLPERDTHRRGGPQARSPPTHTPPRTKRCHWRLHLPPPSVSRAAMGSATGPLGETPGSPGCMQTNKTGKFQKNCSSGRTLTSTLGSGQMRKETHSGVSRRTHCRSTEIRPAGGLSLLPPRCPLPWGPELHLWAARATADTYITSGRKVNSVRLTGSVTWEGGRGQG